VIAVIADDFTGAAEIAGVGLRYGLEGEVHAELDRNCKAELVVVDTDTRWREGQRAAAEVAKLAAQLGQIGPEWIYKKVDSVLRGPVVAELEVCLSALAKDRALLVPANPSMGRQVRAGHYFIDDKPLNKTDFANDPEYPARSSDVLELLGPSETAQISVAGIDQPIPRKGIIVGEASSQADLESWAKCCDAATLPAGGAEFFAALLKVKGFRLRPTKPQVPAGIRKPPITLFVCTSASPAGQKAVEEARGRGVTVVTMPKELWKDDCPPHTVLERWAENTMTALEQNRRVIVAIAQPFVRGPSPARKLRGHTADLVENVLARTWIDELCIEGGSTASAVVRRLGWRRFRPRLELAPGAVRVSVVEKPALHLTIKPGSYPWPDKMWTFKS
jgi:uncharacterized protein YgbK (DUF1537 family)